MFFITPKVITALKVLLRGYVVAIPGARGRSSYVTIRKKKVYNGKAPAAILDLKAAVRLYARIRAFIDFLPISSVILTLVCGLHSLPTTEEPSAVVM